MTAEKEKIETWTTREIINLSYEDAERILEKEWVSKSDVELLLSRLKERFDNLPDAFSFDDKDYLKRVVSKVFLGVKE